MSLGPVASASDHVHLLADARRYRFGMLVIVPVYLRSVHFHVHIAETRPQIVKMDIRMVGKQRHRN